MRPLVALVFTALVAAGCSVFDCDLPRTYTAEATAQTLRVEGAGTPDTLVVAVLDTGFPLLRLDVAPGALQTTGGTAVELTYDARQTGGGQTLVPLAGAMRGDTLFVRADEPLLRQACSPALFEQVVTVRRVAAPAGVRAVRVVQVIDPRLFPTTVPSRPSPLPARLLA